MSRRQISPCFLKVAAARGSRLYTAKKRNFSNRRDESIVKTPKNGLKSGIRNLSVRMTLHRPGGCSEAHSNVQTRISKLSQHHQTPHASFRRTSEDLDPLSRSEIAEIIYNFKRKRLCLNRRDESRNYSLRLRVGKTTLISPEELPGLRLVVNNNHLFLSSTTKICPNFSNETTPFVGKIVPFSKESGCSSWKVGANFRCMR